MMEQINPTLLLGGVVALLAMLWPAYQLVKAVFAPYAKKSDVEAIKADVGGMVTRREYDHHNDGVKTATNMRDTTVNRVLDIHEKSISEAHERVDSLKDAMNKGFTDIRDLIIERLPKP